TPRSNEQNWVRREGGWQRELDEYPHRKSRAQRYDGVRHPRLRQVQLGVVHGWYTPAMLFRPEGKSWLRHPAGQLSEYFSESESVAPKWSHFWVSPLCVASQIDLSWRVLAGLVAARRPL